MSDFVPYTAYYSTFPVVKRSGAIKLIDPANVYSLYFLSCYSMSVATPKSANLATPSSNNKILSGFMSLWIIPFLCISYSAYNISQLIIPIAFSFNFFPGTRLINYNKLPYNAYGNNTLIFPSSPYKFNEETIFGCL